MPSEGLGLSRYPRVSRGDQVNSMCLFDGSAAFLFGRRPPHLWGFWRPPTSPPPPPRKFSPEPWLRFLEGLSNAELRGFVHEAAAPLPRDGTCPSTWNLTASDYHGSSQKAFVNRTKSSEVGASMGGRVSFARALGWVPCWPEKGS